MIKHAVFPETFTYSFVTPEKDNVCGIISDPVKRIWLSICFEIERYMLAFSEYQKFTEAGLEFELISDDPLEYKAIITMKIDHQGETFGFRSEIFFPGALPEGDKIIYCKIQSSFTKNLSVKSKIRYSITDVSTMINQHIRDSLIVHLKQLLC